MKKVYLFLLIVGILLRFTQQFIFPAFNVDEISLGNNLKYSGFIELLYPLKYSQSSPPLFLWLEKLIIQISPLSFWINIKVLSFISSILGILLFYIFIKRNNFKPIFLLLFIILLFNPFIINNSLTLKQYTIDLTGVIFLLVYFKSKTFEKYNWAFFLVWCLLSNIGLFACAGYLIYNFFSQESRFNFNSVFNYIKKNILTILAPLPYIIYFIWFMRQKGAAELQVYMTHYWKDTFIPLNSSIFKYLIYTTHGLWIFLFNAFEIWGLFLILLMIPFFIFLNKKDSLFKSEILLLFCISLVHLILNVFQMYPFSDRLYLYITPLFILILGSSIASISNFKIVKKHFQKIYVLISIVTLLLYTLYTPNSDNDVYGLYQKVNNLDSGVIYTTEKSKNTISSFDKFTDHELTSKKIFISIDTQLEKSKYIVSRVAKKIKRNVTAEEESVILDLIQSGKIKKIERVNGYNIYEIVR
jgi:hypothetical protein